ncbi:Por secretion system C-terminal sorting domain-containing protein [Chryseobacterium sp. RU37D]|uniref:LamG-like jellyroll fold domain-containing protein n=1 Tax=Chryseobacterium sp. RU37D TaxID=1907397 RepID=UPI0009557429|nr:LamG-like jellyroll fold domain-containing protein [Chryseobacterium sp. RU37D]SIQ85584.1 Por secretion system C-terminal sorting domain-containing protein [Chryseobacterium sp. RU37D]
MKKNFLLFSFLVSLSFSAQTPNYVPASGLVAWWGFNGNANDSSSNGNDLTVNNATPTNDRNGMANSAYSFNGINSYLTKSSLTYAFSQTGEHSVSFWMKKADNNSGVAMMNGSTANGNFIWLLQCDATKTIYGTNKQGQSWTWLNGPAYSTSGWEHYVAVYNNQNMTLYKNGTSVGTATNAYTSSTQANLPFYIGREINNAGYINASIDDVGIWNRALTPAEVNQLYTTTLSTSEVEKATGSIAPNPASDFIQINTPMKPVKNYKITDINGRLISEGAISSDKKINVSNLSKGMYFVEIDGVKNFKFLKK